MSSNNAAAAAEPRTEDDGIIAVNLMECFHQDIMKTSRNKVYEVYVVVQGVR